MPKPEGANVELLENVKAPTPYMRADVAQLFRRLRQEVVNKAGFDFLGICGDVMRAAGFVSDKDGVANRSWHKCGVVFDYDQASPHIVIVSEPKDGKQYFRTYLMCQPQDGTLGKKIAVNDKRGYRAFGYLFDFTSLAESYGFKRIPAWNGWKEHYNRQEFWHYQCDNGMMWNQAMALIYPAVTGQPAAPVIAPDAVLGLNDRGPAVKRLQERLAGLGYLPISEIDGVFGVVTFEAVKKFQAAKGLTSDGLVGPSTRAKLAL